MKKDVKSGDMLGVIDTVFINSKPVFSYVPFDSDIYFQREDRLSCQ